MCALFNLAILLYVFVGFSNNYAIKSSRAIVIMPGIIPDFFTFVVVNIHDNISYGSFKRHVYVIYSKTN